MEETVHIKVEPFDSAEESEQIETQPEFITIKNEIEENVKSEETFEEHESCNNIINLCVVKEEIEEDDFIIPDLGGPQGPVTSVDGVSEADLSVNAVEHGKYTCAVCCRGFDNKGHLIAHKSLHSKQKLECHICLLRLNSLQEYENHIANHERKYACEVCDKRFLSAARLKQHSKIHSGDKPYRCDECLREFTVKGSLIRHQRAGTCQMNDAQPLICNVCGQVFQKEFLLRSHLRRHAFQKPFQCDMCDMQFKYKSTLTRHIQAHNDVRPFSCKFCDKTFTHAGLIKPHLRKHTGEKPFSCPVCDKRFAHKCNMLRHSILHEKEKNLECQLCHKIFPRESRLIYHMRSHTNSKPFKCDVCSKKFSHKHNVMRHYQRKHPSETYEAKFTDATIAKQVWQKVQKKLNEDKEEDWGDGD